MDRPSPVHMPRKWAVSPKVMRENGPVGSCLTHTSCDAPRSRVTASAFPSGERDTELMPPWTFQVVSIWAPTPSRPTHHAALVPEEPPEVYTSVPLVDTATFTSN